jgi:hypothetical protein
MMRWVDGLFLFWMVEIPMYSMSASSLAIPPFFAYAVDNKIVSGEYEHECECIASATSQGSIHPSTNTPAQ